MSFDPPSPSPGRRLLLLAVLGALLAGHLFCFLNGRRDLWPFSVYAMYSRVRDPVQADHIVLVGVRADDPQREHPVYLDWQQQRPLYRGSLNRNLGNWARLPDAGASRARLEAAAQDCLNRYRRRRLTGEHDGPELAGMRVYRLVWRYAEVDGPGAVPTQRELLAEVRG